jgi:hypothetical protein
MRDDRAPTGIDAICRGGGGCVAARLLPLCLPRPPWRAISMPNCTAAMMASVKGEFDFTHYDKQVKRYQGIAGIGYMF